MKSVLCLPQGDISLTRETIFSIPPHAGTTPRNKPKAAMPTRAIIAALLVAICWGGNYTTSKFALMEFPPFLLLLLRFLGVAIVLLPFLPRYPIPRMREMFIISMTLGVIQFAMMFTALHMGLSVTAMIIAAQLGVPFSCVMAAILFKDYLGPWRSAGLALAFLGVVIVAGTPSASEHWGAFLMAIVASLAWSSANIYLKTIKAPSTVPLLFWPALFSLIPFLLLSLATESNQLEIMQTASLEAWACIGYSVVFASLVGYGLWNWLVATFPVSQVMPFGLLMPIFGITIGALALDEAITHQLMLGGALALTGVGIITLRRPKLAELER